MEWGYWIASGVTEMILKIISQFSAKFFKNFAIDFLYFSVIFELIDLQGQMNFSGHADIILDRFQKHKMVLNIYLKRVFLRV